MLQGKTIPASFAAGGSSTAATQGKWQPAFATPVVAIHMHLLPTGKVILWGDQGDSQLWDPANQVSYGSGSCSTSSSNTPLSLAPANGRFQIVAPPGQETTGKALRVELRPGDLWPCATCSGR